MNEKKKKNRNKLDDELYMDNGFTYGEKFNNKRKELH